MSVAEVSSEIVAGNEYCNREAATLLGLDRKRASRLKKRLGVPSKWSGADLALAMGSQLYRDELARATGQSVDGPEANAAREAEKKAGTVRRYERLVAEQEERAAKRRMCQAMSPRIVAGSYASPTDALEDACDAMYSANRCARGSDIAGEIYAAKNRLMQYLYEGGYCIAVDQYDDAYDTRVNRQYDFVGCGCDSDFGDVCDCMFDQAYDENDIDLEDFEYDPNAGSWFMQFRVGTREYCWSTPKSQAAYPVRATDAKPGYPSDNIPSFGASCIEASIALIDYVVGAVKPAHHNNK